MYPIIPESSLKVLNIFNIGKKIKLNSISDNEYLVKGKELNKIDILFKK